MDKSEFQGEEIVRNPLGCTWADSIANPCQGPTNKGEGYKRQQQENFKQRTDQASAASATAAAWFG